MADVVLVLQLSVMEQRCRSVVTEKNGLEEKLAEAEKAKKASDKKIQQVGGGGGGREGLIIIIVTV